MNNRIMVKIYGTNESYSLRTISRDFRSPHGFIILKDTLEELERKDSVIVKDMHSYAKLSLYKNQTGQRMLQIDFTWLEASGNVIIEGRKEIVRLPYNIFRDPVFDELCREQDKKILSIQLEEKKPKVIFESRSHLREVVNRPMLRNKLGRFLDCHFDWMGSQYIVISDDYEPYSFVFTEYRDHGVGLCGAIILHGWENLKTAHYCIHT